MKFVANVVTGSKKTLALASIILEIFYRCMYRARVQPQSYKANAMQQVFGPLCILTVWGSFYLPHLMVLTPIKIEELKIKARDVALMSIPVADSVSDVDKLTTYDSYAFTIVEPNVLGYPFHIIRSLLQMTELPVSWTYMGCPRKGNQSLEPSFDLYDCKV